MKCTLQDLQRRCKDIEVKSVQDDSLDEGSAVLVTSQGSSIRLGHYGSLVEVSKDFQTIWAIRSSRGFMALSAEDSENLRKHLPQDKLFDYICWWDGEECWVNKGAYHPGSVSHVGRSLEQVFQDILDFDTPGLNFPTPIGMQGQPVAGFIESIAKQAKIVQEPVTDDDSKTRIVCTVNWGVHPEEDRYVCFHVDKADLAGRSVEDIANIFFLPMALALIPLFGRTSFDFRKELFNSWSEAIK